MAITGYHRKHATRVLGNGTAEPQRPVRNRLYDEAVRQALVVLWEAGDRICGEQLKPLIPILIAAMERHGHLDLDPAVKARLLQISAATIDRCLSEARAHIDGKRHRRTGVGAAIRRSIPVAQFSVGDNSNNLLNGELLRNNYRRTGRIPAAVETPAKTETPAAESNFRGGFLSRAVDVHLPSTETTFRVTLERKLHAKLLDSSKGTPLSIS